ncbi:MAG TPA: ATP-binding protein [Pirellulales bacterium]|nr:ATP-binding protein [Pirellulales bacterium]
MHNKKGGGIRTHEARVRFFAIDADLLLVFGFDGFCREISPTCELTLGWTPAEFTSRPWQEFLHPDDRAATLELDQRVKQGHEILSFENRFRHKDGSYRWLNWKAKPVPAERIVYAGATDVTDRKQSELLRAGQHQVLEMIATGKPLADVLAAVCRVIEQQEPGLLCSIVLTDYARQQMGTGYGPSLPASLISALQGVPISPPYACPCCQALHCGQEVLVADIEGDRRWSSSWRDLMLSQDLRACRSIPIRGSNGNVLASVALFRRQAGDPGPANKERLSIATRLAGIAIERRQAGEQPDFSHISHGKVDLRIERVELTTVVEHTVETSRPVLQQSGHDLTTDVPPGSIYVDADPTRLSQVFSNLLNNAAKYTERGGRIRLIVRQEGGEVIVGVKDNGIGIPADMLPNVFDMFMQVDRNLERSQAGLGVGLSIVKRLVEMHNGSVEARSDGHGMGSEFLVRLPVVLSITPPKEDKATTLPSSNGQRVLVVDDNRDAAVSLAMMLKLLGHEVNTAHDGLEALDVAAAFLPDLILLDIGMPRLNGFETAKRIRALPWGKGVRLVALTGWGQDEDRRKSQEVGFDSHMVKPIDFAALQKLLAALQVKTA